jgi:hypothetical protein
VPDVSATGDQPAGVAVQEIAAGVHAPKVPLAVQVCVPPALQVAALPHGWVVVGTHVPVHVP